MFAGIKRVDKARLLETHRRVRERALRDRGLNNHEPPSKIENVVHLIRRASAYVGGRPVKVALVVYLPLTTTRGTLLTLYRRARVSACCSLV